MICRAVLTLLAVGLAAAQLEYVQYTAGLGGGEICGRYHYCHSDARCERETRHGQTFKMCACQNDLIGNGNLFCKDRHDNSLYIQNDPHMKNFYNEFAGLPSPCRFRLAHLVMVISEDTTAVVELFGENLLFKGGEYFLTRLTLSTNLILAGDMMKQTMQFYGDVSAEGNYTLIAKSIESEGFTIGEEGVVLDEGKAGFMGYTMDVGKDAVNNLLTVKIPNLGITLLFRPPSIESELNNLELRMVPGAVFLVDHEHWPFVHIEESDLELSSWPTGPSLKKVAEDMHISLPILVQYLMLNNSLSDPIYNDEICLETGRIFREQCSSESTQLRMLESCTPIYTNEDFLKLIADLGISNRYMALLKTFYQRCEKAFCLNVKQDCESLKKDLEHEFKDRLPRSLLDKIDCSGLSDSVPSNAEFETFDEQPVEPVIE